MMGHPKLDADHRPGGDAAFDFRKTLLDVVAADVAKPKGAIVVVLEGLEHLIILFLQIFRSRLFGPAHAHIEAEPLDSHAVGDFDELPHALGRRAARNAGEVAVEIPDHWRFGFRRLGFRGNTLVPLAQWRGQRAINGRRRSLAIVGWGPGRGEQIYDLQGRKEKALDDRSRRGPSRGTKPAGTVCRRVIAFRRARC